MINPVSDASKLTWPKFSKTWLPLSFFLLTGGLLVFLIFAILGYQIWFLNRAYPGVSVAGIKVNGLTRPEIATAVAAQSATYLNHPIIIQVDDESWSFTGQELGMKIDIYATADQAYLVGRSGNLPADMLTQLSLLFTPQHIDPVIQYDSGPTNQILQQLTQIVNYPPQDAQLIINPTGQTELVPSRRGRRLHVDATRPLIEAALFSSNPQPVVAFTQEVIPAITTDEAEPAYRQAKQLLSRPLTFRFKSDANSSEWQLTPDTLAPMINTFETAGAGGQSQLAIELDQDKLRPYFEQFAAAINQEASDARLRFDEEKGELTVLQQSRNGRALDIDAIDRRVETAIANGSSTINLPVVITPATISSDDLDSLGIKELVSESTSYFKGSSQGRVNNIALSASKFDGVVVAPGQIFSFNKYLGPITAEAGFDESLIIYGDRTTVGIGGGVCQVSTTAFRAAFFGGFELVERWAHGYRVSWYEIGAEPGLDATIYTPDVDFKFRNDTENYILIQTETDKEAGTLTFKFYGTPTEREVIVSEPVITNEVKHGPPVYEETDKLPQGIIKQVDWAKDGMDVSVTRVVKAGDEVIHEDDIISRYKPWQAVYQVGTGNS